MHHSRFRFHHYRNSQTTYAIQRAHCHHQCTEHSVDIGRKSRYHPHRDGRRVQSAYPSLTGKMAADSLKGFHANKLFLATAGISPDMSLTYPSLSDLMVKSAMIKTAEEVILVADSSKIGISAFASLGSITMVNSFITDNHISKENIEKMKGKNINLLIG